MVLGVTCFPYQADVLPFVQAEILPFVHDLNSILLAKNKTKKKYSKLTKVKSNPSGNLAGL